MRAVGLIVGALLAGLPFAGTAMAYQPQAPLVSEIEQALSAENAALATLHKGFEVHDWWTEQQTTAEDDARVVVEDVGKAHRQLEIIDSQANAYLSEVASSLKPTESTIANSDVGTIQRQAGAAIAADNKIFAVPLLRDVEAYESDPTSAARKAIVEGDVEGITRDLQSAGQQKRDALATANRLPTGGLQVYPYWIRVAGSGKFTSFSVFNYLWTATGAVNGTFSVPYEVAITVSPRARTIAVHSLEAGDQNGTPLTEPTPTASSFTVGGTSAFSITENCTGGPSLCPADPTWSCSYSAASITPYYSPAGGRLLMPGLGTPDQSSYTNGALWMTQYMNQPTPSTAPAPTTCTGTSVTESPADPGNIPGFDGPPFGEAPGVAPPGNFGPIPVSELGRTQVTHAFTATGTCLFGFDQQVDGCTSDVTVTMKLLPASRLGSTAPPF